MADTPITAYVGLGSNLDDPARQLNTALEELRQLPDSTMTGVSSLYTSPPMGPSDQPDYVNAVCALETRLGAEGLLDHLQQIEQCHQRIRTIHWGPRTLDLDLLLYGDQSIRSPRLQVPHPGIAERAFVLLPLAELVGEGFVVPGKGAVGELLAGVDCQGLERLGGMG